MSGPVVPFQRPRLPAPSAIAGYLERSYESHWFSNNGPCVRLLRERLGERIGVSCVPVANATAGLMAAITALLSDAPAEHRREVLLPSFTFAATIQAVLWAGLRPRLVDISPDHWHLDPASLEDTLADRGDRVALVVAVTSFGTPPPAEVSRRWSAACAAAGVPLLIDGAAGFGASDADGVPVGALGDIDVVSFHATKPFAIGEGGAVFARDEDLLARVEQATNFGLRPDGQVAMAGGLNAKMSETHAATALAELELYDGILDARRASAAEVRAVADGVTFQAECERSTWQFIPAAFADAGACAAAEDRCRGKIEVRHYYRPLHQMAPFRELPLTNGGLGATEELAARLLCLPMANDLSTSERATISRVCLGA